MLVDNNKAAERPKKMKVEGIEGLIENLDKITSVFGTGVIRISDKNWPKWVG